MIAGGMAAELAVFDADPLTCDIKQLPNLKPVLTMVDGHIVHQSTQNKNAIFVLLTKSMPYRH